MMKFIEKIRDITKEAKNFEHTYPRVAKAIESSAEKGNNWCSMKLSPEEIQALRAEGFTIKEAPFLFDFGYDIEW